MKDGSVCDWDMLFKSRDAAIFFAKKIEEELVKAYVLSNEKGIENSEENLINELKEKTVSLDVNKEKNIVFLNSNRLSIQLLGFNNKNLSKQFLENHIASDDDIKYCYKLKDRHEDFLTEKALEKGMELYMYGLEFSDIDGLSKISFDELTWDKSIENCEVSKFYDCIVFKNNHSKSFDFLINVLSNSYKINFLDEEFKSIPNHSIKNVLDTKIQKLEPVILHMFYYNYE